MPKGTRDNRENFRSSVDSRGRLPLPAFLCKDGKLFIYKMILKERSERLTVGVGLMTWRG